MPTRWRKKKKREKEIGRGPIEQCVGYFCSVPRGGVKNNNNNNKKQENKGKIGRGPIERCVGKFRSVPRGGVKGKKISVGDRLCNQVLNFCSLSLCPTRWRKNGRRRKKKGKKNLLTLTSW